MPDKASIAALTSSTAALDELKASKEEAQTQLTAEQESQAPEGASEEETKEFNENKASNVEQFEKKIEELTA